MIRSILALLALAGIAILPVNSQEKIALVGATVIDGTDRPPRANATIVIQGTRIAAILSSKQPLPPETRKIDATGEFIIPGLWNNDLHGSYEDGKTHFPDLLAAGITTIRDMGAPLDDIVRLRDASASGTLVGPRVFIAGPLMEGPTPVQLGLIVDLFSESQAREEVRALKKAKVDYVEVDTTLTPELYWAVADEAKQQRLPLVGHIPPKISPWDLTKAPQTDIEHLGGRFFNVMIACSSDQDYFMKRIADTYDDLLNALNEKKSILEPQFKADFDQRLLDTFDSRKAQRLFRIYAKNGIAQTPTLFVLKTLWETNKDRNHLDDRDMEAGKRIFAKDLEIVGEMKRDGVPILAGTDGPYEQGGDALHSELNLLVDAGLTPLQALQAASRDAARAMGIADEVGTIEVGKTADLVVLHANPLLDITNTSKVDAVVLRGRYLSQQDLASLKNP